MGAPGLTSPIRREGLQHLQLNAGVFLANFPADRLFSADGVRAEVAYRLEHNEGVLGMTRGGGTFTLGREPRTPDVDGRRYLHVGAQFVDSMDASITGTLIEIVPAAWQAVIGTTEPLESNTATRAAYRVKTVIGDGAYLENLCWVGDVADGGMCVIVFDNALNTADVAFTFQDKNEGTLPFELHAHQGNVLTYDTAPARVCFYQEGIAYQRAFNTPMSVIGGVTYGSAPFDIPKDLPEGTYTLTFYSPGTAKDLNKLDSGSQGLEYHNDSVDGHNPDDVWHQITLADCIGDDVFQLRVHLGPKENNTLDIRASGTITETVYGEPDPETQISLPSMTRTPFSATIMYLTLTE